jgi:hypothetical protein
VPKKATKKTPEQTNKTLQPSFPIHQLKPIATPLEPASQAKSTIQTDTDRSVTEDARPTPQTRRRLGSSAGAAAAGTRARAGAARAAAAALSRNLALQVLHRAAHIAGVSQMPRRNEQRTTANTVRSIAVSLRLLGREVGDLAAFLAVAGVAVQHDTCDALLDRRVELGDGVDHDGRALRVAGRHDDRVRALLRRVLEDADRFVVGGGRGAAGQRVGADAGGVGASYTLAGDVVVVGFLEAVAGRGADGGTLGMRC